VSWLAWTIAGAFLIATGAYFLVALWLYARDVWRERRL
jgi:hypothetical protein